MKAKTNTNTNTNTYTNTNTKSSNTNSEITDVTTPLTREELASFYLISKLDTQEMMTKIVTDVFNEYTAQFNKAMNLISDAIKTNSINCNNAITELNTNMIKAMNNIQTMENNKMQKMQELEDARLQCLTDLQNVSINAINNIADRIDNAASQSRKQFYAITNNLTTTQKKDEINPLFKESMYDKQKQLLWVGKVRGIIDDHCLTKGINKGAAYNHVWGELKKTYNLGALLKEYRKAFNFPSADMMEMIAASDTLRVMFVSVYDRYVRRFEKANHKPGNLQNLTMVRSSVSKLSPSGATPGRIYQRAYNVVNKKASIDIKEAAKSVIEKNHLNKSISIPMAISYDDNLTKIFCGAIDQYLKETSTTSTTSTKNEEKNNG